MTILQERKKHYYSLIAKVTLIVMTAAILSGCGLRPKMAVRTRIPSHLADDALIPVVYGHYGKPLSNNIEELKIEATDRAKDYIVCRTSLDNNNIEMAAIRALNK